MTLVRWPILYYIDLDKKKMESKIITIFVPTVDKSNIVISC